MTKLRVGIIGFGRIGAEHAAWLEQCKNIHSTAVADITPARQAMAHQRGLTIHNSLERLIDDPSIDAILISTPTSMHFDHASASLRAGKHVMLEKPMAMNLPQAKELIDLANSRQRVLSVFHNRRWDPDFLTAAQAVASGVFGKIINIESRLGQWASCVGPAAKEYHPAWRTEASFGGGGLLDWGSHFLDQIWRLLLPSRHAPLRPTPSQRLVQRRRRFRPHLHRLRQRRRRTGRDQHHHHSPPSTLAHRRNRRLSRKPPQPKFRRHPLGPTRFHTRQSIIPTPSPPTRARRPHRIPNLGPIHRRHHHPIPTRRNRQLRPPHNGPIRRSPPKHRNR